MRLHSLIGIAKILAQCDYSRERIETTQEITKVRSILTVRKYEELKGF